jgi:SAM domain (Sterile alpha motif)
MRAWRATFSAIHHFSWDLLVQADYGSGSYRAEAVAESRYPRLAVSTRIMARCASRGAIMDVGGWLQKLGLEQYEAAFRENMVDCK